MVVMVTAEVREEKNAQKFVFTVADKLPAGIWSNNPHMSNQSHD